MQYDFDRQIDRRNSDSTKWNYYAEDVLPLWTADMDFQVPEPVIQALHQRIDHGVFGYCREPRELREVIVSRLFRLYGWRIMPEATYVAWLDCRRSAIRGNPYRFFLDKARVGLSDGSLFGRGGNGFVRLNFACPRSTLLGALHRMKDALNLCQATAF